jgi:hypothetical protein
MKTKRPFGWLWPVAKRAMLKVRIHPAWGRAFGQAQPLEPLARQPAPVDTGPEQPDWKKDYDLGF